MESFQGVFTISTAGVGKLVKKKKKSFDVFFCSRRDKGRNIYYMLNNGLRWESWFTCCQQAERTVAQLNQNKTTNLGRKMKRQTHRTALVSDVGGWKTKSPRRPVLVCEVWDLGDWIRPANSSKLRYQFTLSLGMSHNIGTNIVNTMLA